MQTKNKDLKQHVYALYVGMNGDINYRLANLMITFRLFEIPVET